MKFYKCIIYDFDGVICDSVNLKTEAFVSMYKPYGQEIVEKIKSYHLMHGGISRYEKFRYYSEVILNKKISDEELLRLGEIFSQIVLKKIVNAPINPGVIEFLERNLSNSKQFICSGTPQEEMKYIIKEKKLCKYFENIFGSPTSKTNIISNILFEYNLKSSEILFFGDAMTDYLAANETCIDFVGIENVDTSFPPGTTTIKSFNELIEHE
jgi:phosphoglycolate phosphatase-like HAD superfamily hydrolase